MYKRQHQKTEVIKMELENERTSTFFERLIFESVFSLYVEVGNQPKKLPSPSGSIRCPAIKTNISLLSWPALLAFETAEIIKCYREPDILWCSKCQVSLTKHVITYRCSFLYTNTKSQFGLLPLCLCPQL